MVSAHTFSGSCLKQATPRDRTERVLAALQTALYRSSMHLAAGKRATTAPVCPYPGERAPRSRYRDAPPAPPHPSTHGLSSDFLAPRPLSSCGATNTVRGPSGPAAPRPALPPTTPAHRVHGHEGGGAQRQDHGRPQLRQVVALHVHHRHPRRARHRRARTGPPLLRLPAACPPRAPHALPAPRPALPALAAFLASSGNGGNFYLSQNPFSPEIWN